jgi:branched-subunit amino acid aminotransferase/4-amino-4-deoxychorismate lyase
MAETTLYQFTGSELTPVTWCQPGQEKVVVAESWRVVEGQAVGLTHHLDRFRRSVAHEMPDEVSTVDTFVRLALGLIPDTGEWFPRMECVQTTHGHLFRFYHREAPERLTTACLATAPHDPRTQPLVKGPDLTALMALRKEVAPTGATEAVIVTSEGFIAEGAYSSIIVWPPGNEQMWVVDSDIPRIPSVTEHLVANMARSQGIAVVGKKMLPSALEQHMVWVVSALHGIREAPSWVEGPVLGRNTDMTRDWNERLLAQAGKVASSSQATERQ